MHVRNLVAVILSSACLLIGMGRACAEETALEKAKASISAYFNAILKGESTLVTNMAMSEAIQNVPDKDQSALQDYYDSTSVAAAQKAVDAYAQEVKVGRDTSGAADRMHEMEDALSPENLQKIKLYYKQKKLPASVV